MKTVFFPPSPLFGLCLAMASLAMPLLSAPALRLAAVSKTDAERMVAGDGSYDTVAAGWIWSDKLVYTPGEALTLRGTLKPNSDFYPYTLFAFRVNNQTGARSFLPAGTEEVTDIFGNREADGFRITRLPELNKTVLVGAGGLVGTSAVTIPQEFGMHTLVLQLRDFTGNRVIKSIYTKISVVRERVDLPAEISADRTLTNDRAYRISGIVQVRNNATLTIEPGTVLEGQPGSQPPSVLLVTTTGRLVAEGTRSRPIIMTSSQPIGRRQRGDWGGLILLGRAPINDPSGRLNIEGLPDSPDTLYGGTDANHNCGSLRYVRVEFAGALLRPNEETNSFTWGGCGKATRAEYLQAHYGLDDSFEWFGGNNDARYLVGTYGADDYVDVQIGYTGRLQHVLALANADLSNRGIEADNYERDFNAAPLGAAQMYNFTMVGNAARGFDETDAAGILLRRGAAGTYNNMVVYNWSSSTLSIANNDSVVARLTANPPTLQMNGLLLWDNGKNANLPNTVDRQVNAAYSPYVGAGRPLRQFVAADPLMRRPLEYSDPDFRPTFASPLLRANWVLPPDDGFFDQTARYIGAFGDVNWAEEWATFVQEQDLQ